MGYRHSMVCHTEGIHPVAPVKWRGLDGLVGVFWEAEGDAGANAYYLSPDPRIVIFFNDVSSHIRMSDSESGFGRQDRPMTRAIYVPAGMPMWTKFTSRHRFSHLDLHLHQDRLLRFLTPAVGGSAARSIVRQPVEIQDVGPIEMLAGLIVDEVSNPTKHSVYAESLIGSIAAALLDIPPEVERQPGGRITQGQMNRLASHFTARSGGRMSVAEMAEVVGLSESWFATVFKETTGQTPFQWQRARRIESAQALLTGTELSLADIAAQLGFFDQAHLTKVFRQTVGETPAAWRRTQPALQMLKSLGRTG